MRGVGYNLQIAVNTKHNPIAEQQVRSKVSDLGLLAETAVAACGKAGRGTKDSPPQTARRTLAVKFVPGTDRPSRKFSPEAEECHE